MTENEWQMEQAERKAQEADQRKRREALFVKIAEALWMQDGTWSKVPVARPADTERDSILHTSGAELHMSVSAGRLRIGGSFHSQHGSLYDYRPYREHKPSYDITVSASRAPGDIAKEIMRRLGVAEFLTEFDEALSRKRALESSRANAEVMGLRLARLLGDEHMVKKLTAGDDTYTRRDGDVQVGRYSGIQVSLSTYDESSKIEVQSKSYEELLALVHAIKAITDKRPKEQS